MPVAEHGSPFPPIDACDLAAVLVVRGAMPALESTVDQLRHAVGTVVVVNNDDAQAPAGPDQRAVDATQASVLRLWNGNRGGLAGAYNQALQVLNAQHHPPRWVVFVDQDSDVAALGRLLADPEAHRLLHGDDVAAVAPAYRDRATGLRGRYIDLQRWSLQHLPREFEGPRAVAFVINSMSVWRTQALQRLGPFNETLAVDHVDTDYCLRARSAGLSLWVQGSVEFAHAIGARRRYRLLGRELQAGGHSPQRRWLIARNTAWLARRWLWREPAFAALCLMRLGYEATGIVMAEDHKAAKLWAWARGLVRGLVMQAR